MRLYRGKLAVVTAEKPDAAALLEEAEELLRRAGFDDSYGTERRKLSAEDAARLAEAERIVHEAAREKELLQEEAMLRGGGKAAAESASVERNAGKGKATDAGGVEAKIETVKPAEEGRFDWKQAGMTEKNTWTLAKALTQCMI